MLTRGFSIAAIVLVGSMIDSGLSWSPIITSKSNSMTTLLQMSHGEGETTNMNRRDLFQSTASIMAAFTVPQVASADEDGVNIDNFLKTGMVQQPMGVSGQAGKMKPETGVILREGSQVARDARSGNVLAEILVGPSSNPAAVVASYSSPWPLASGTVFDVECRDAKTGDGAFLAVTESTKGKSLAEIPSSFFLDQVMKPTGRFSFYGAPTDIKVKKDKIVDDYRFVELSFSNLSQSTMTEIPRKAIIATTIVPGTENAVMLIGSATATRWKKGASESVAQTVESFRVVAAPKSAMKIRAQQKS